MMNNLLHVFSDQTTHALGWTIIHSIWQGALIALLMTMLHSTWSKNNAQKRYNISVFAMILMLVSSLVTFCYYMFPSVGGIGQEIVIAGTPQMATESAIVGFSLVEYINNNISIINMIWITGTLVFLARFFLGYAYIRFLKYTAITTASDHLLESLERIRQKVNVDKIIAIKESIHVQTPVVIGHFKPMILFPLGLVNHLTIDEVDAIITHELAHITRNDFITNLLLTIVEAIYYYHPAVWWISANIRAERENCCDDIALSSVEKLLYTKTLLKIEEMKSSHIPSLAMPLFKNKHQLLNRIKRIMNIKQSKNDMKEKGMATVLFTALVLLFATQANSTESVQQNDINITTEAPLKLNGETIDIEMENGKVVRADIDNSPVSTTEKEALNNMFSNKDASGEKLTFKMKMKGNTEMKIEGDSMKFFADTVFVFDMVGDTTPITKEKVILKDDNQNIELNIENGKVKKMVIDGKVIPESEYDNHLDIIEMGNGNSFQMMDMDLDFPMNFNFDSIIGNSFGMILENGDHWKDFGSREEWIENLNELENMEDFDVDVWIQGLDEMKSINMDSIMLEINSINLDSIMGVVNGINIDSVVGAYRFDFDFDNDFPNNRAFRNKSFTQRRNPTVVDAIGTQLNRDGLLTPFKNNEIEISGKHLKINGEKMPKAIYNKYKAIYEEKTGAPLTKKTKMIFEIEGKKTKRRVRSF